MSKSKAKKNEVDITYSEEAVLASSETTPVVEKRELKFPATLVHPSTVFEGDDLHPLQELFLGDPENWPEMKCVGYIRLPRVYDRKPTTKVKDTGNYVSYVATIKGGEVVSIDVEQPDLRAIAEEATKIAFVDQLMAGEE